MKKVLLLIASQGFQPLEYSQTKEVFEQSGFQVLTGSDKVGLATDTQGKEVQVDIALENIDAADVDGIFWIGGPGAMDHLDNQESNRIANECMLMQKIYGAICIAPRILAKAHVMTGKKATGWNGDEKLEQIFTENNVSYLPDGVVIDKNVITADGPGSARAFGEAIVATLKKS